MTNVEPGKRVTWNADGQRLFGATLWTALVVAIEDDTAQLLWESGQETYASVSCLQTVTETPPQG